MRKAALPGIGAALQRVGVEEGEPTVSAVASSAMASVLRTSVANRAGAEARGEVREAEALRRGQAAAEDGDEGVEEEQAERNGDGEGHAPDHETLGVDAPRAAGRRPAMRPRSRSCERLQRLGRKTQADAGADGHEVARAVALDREGRRRAPSGITTSRTMLPR